MEMNNVSLKDEKTVQMTRLNGALALLEKERRTITYEDLGRTIGVPASSADFTQLLSQSMKEDHNKSQPFRCSLVVSAKPKTDNPNHLPMPGAGFFAEAEKLIGRKFIDTRERVNFWKTMRNRVWFRND